MTGTECYRSRPSSSPRLFTLFLHSNVVRNILIFCDCLIMRILGMRRRILSSALSLFLLLSTSKMILLSVSMILSRVTRRLTLLGNSTRVRSRYVENILHGMYVRSSQGLLCKDLRHLPLDAPSDSVSRSDGPFPLIF